jgi:hypothetical protein
MTAVSRLLVSVKSNPSFYILFELVGPGLFFITRLLLPFLYVPLYVVIHLLY